MRMRARRVGENSTSRNRRSTILCPIAGVCYRTALFVCVLDDYFFGLFYVTSADRCTFDFRAHVRICSRDTISVVKNANTIRVVRR